MVDLAALYKETGDIPWVVGLCGGKDSTALTVLLLETVQGPAGRRAAHLRHRVRSFSTEG